MLLRTGANGEATTVTLNVDDIVAKRTADMSVHGGDILYVPKANISVYVGGEVTRPGLLPLNGELTVMAAVIQAGGMKDSAKSNTVMLVRDTGDGKPIVKKLALDDVIKGKPDTKLEPFDVVYVPRSTISRVDRFIDQYIRQVIPFNVAGGFSYILGAGVIH
jgi:protein involved in polysaccharide export with SLBB domain